MDKWRLRVVVSNIIFIIIKVVLVLYKVLFNFKNKMYGYSVRVFSFDVFMIDLSLFLEKKVFKDFINDLLIEVFKGVLKGVLEIDLKERVSFDFIFNLYSVIIAFDLIFMLENMVKIMGWYDNEWGYFNCLVDMA